MTLGELWEELGSEYADIPIVLDINGNGAVPLRGAGPAEDDNGNAVILLTNLEGS